ncbi:MAG: TolC family protein [Magnetococcales bacterium]|nr:TolC family protein [Magnetococcales bacterium]
MRQITLTITLLVLALVGGGRSACAALTLQEAERLALEKDPTVAQLMAESNALSQKAIADGSLKDPRLTLGVVSVPLDTFDMEQEAMTQEKIGIQQGFPRGDTLKLERQQTDSMAQQKRLAAELENRKIVQEVRIAYQDVLYQQLAYQSIQASQKFLKQLMEIVEFRYSSGKASRQDFMEASLAHSRTADRLLKVKNQEDAARARLSKWIPREAAFGKLASSFVALPVLPPPAEMNGRLAKHPVMQIADQQIQTQGLDLLKAKEQYKPGWMIDASYGYRQGDNPNKTPRSDFVSLMVSMDMPLFTENRQDRLHDARRIQVQAAEWGRDDRLRTLASDLELYHAEYLRLGERLQVFDKQLLPEAKQYTETAMVSYQSGVADLTSVMRAHLAELAIRLDQLEVRYKRLVTQARLLFIVGEQG